MQADQINWLTTIGNMGLWTRLGIPTKAAHLETHHLVRFFVGFSCSFDFCVGCTIHVGRAGFILFMACNSNPFPPMHQTTKNCDANCGCLWYNLWEIKDRI